MCANTKATNDRESLDRVVTQRMCVYSWFEFTVVWAVYRCCFCCNALLTHHKHTLTTRPDPLLRHTIYYNDTISRSLIHSISSCVFTCRQFQHTLHSAIFREWANEWERRREIANARVVNTNTFPLLTTKEPESHEFDAVLFAHCELV